MKGPLLLAILIQTQSDLDVNANSFRFISGNSHCKFSIRRDCPGARSLSTQAEDTTRVSKPKKTSSLGTCVCMALLQERLVLTVSKKFHCEIS